MTDPAAKPPRKKRRWLRVLLVLLLVLVALPIASLWFAVSAKPSYWRVIDGKNPDILAAAEKFEQAMSTQLTQVREDQPVWTLELAQDDMNNWLAARLPQWAANRGVDQQVLDQIARSMINSDGKSVEMAMQLESGGIKGVMRLRYKPTLGENQRVRLVLEEAHAGLIPLPIDTVFDSIIGPYAPNKQKGQLETIRSRVQSLELTVPLGDGREVSIVGMELAEGKIVLTCKTHR